MISVTFILSGETRLTFGCPEQGPLYDQINELINGLFERRVDLDQTVQLQIDDSKGSRGVAVSPKSIQAVETDPSDAFAALATPALARTAPYIRIPEFLPASNHDEILEFALSMESKFGTSSVVTGDDEQHSSALHIRNSSSVTDLDDLPPAFQTELRALVPDVMKVLELDAPEQFDIELQLTAHNDGAFYKMHRDNSTPGTSTRQLTFVYYFHRHPKRFSGGNIRLFDIMKDNGAAAESFVDVEPDDNCLLLFPSSVPHEVLRVVCPSGDMQDSRFTLNGWLRFA